MMFAALLASMNATFSANQLVLLSYWLLIVGGCCLFIELFQKKGKVKFNPRTNPITGTQIDD
jgi:hypothetical protein